MSQSEPVFGRLGAAIVTPFTDDLERVDHDALAVLARHLVDEGHDLLVANGTTGESPTTSDEEKLAILKTLREAVGHEATILAGAGSNDTRHSVSLARAIEEGGNADGLLLVTPYYSKPTQQGLITHTIEIVNAVDLPAMLYDIPGRSGIPIEYESAVELSQHPNIVALKEAKGDMHGASKLIRDTDLDLYSGEDALNLPWLAVGAVGTVSVTSHLTGRLDRLMLDALASGDLVLAQRIHASRVDFVDAIMNQGPGTMAVKEALTHLGVLPHAGCRGPLGTVESEVAARIHAAVDAYQGVLAQYIS